MFLVIIIFLNKKNLQVPKQVDTRVHQDIIVCMPLIQAPDKGRNSYPRQHLILHGKDIDEYFFTDITKFENWNKN